MEPADITAFTQRHPILRILNFPDHFMNEKVVDVVSSEEFFLRAIETQDDSKEN